MSTEWAASVLAAVVLLSAERRRQQVFEGSSSSNLGSSAPLITFNKSLWRDLLSTALSSNVVPTPDTLAIAHKAIARLFSFVRTEQDYAMLPYPLRACCGDAIRLNIGSRDFSYIQVLGTEDPVHVPAEVLQSVCSACIYLHTVPGRRHRRTRIEVDQTTLEQCRALLLESEWKGEKEGEARGIAQRVLKWLPAKPQVWGREAQLVCKTALLDVNTDDVEGLTQVCAFLATVPGGSSAIASKHPEADMSQILAGESEAWEAMYEKRRESASVF